MLDFNDTAACGLAAARINFLDVAAELATDMANAADRAECIRNRLEVRHHG